MRSTTFLSAFLFASSALAVIDPIAIDANSRPVLKDVYIIQRDDGSFAKRDGIVSFFRFTSCLVESVLQRVLR